jgi:hypothetical protein
MIRRLVDLKMMVAGLKDAMPTLAAQIRREACEEIEDLIGDLRRGASA